MSLLTKLELYVRASASLRGPNWRGLPLLPKSWLRLPPRNRAAYNEFVLWIGRLNLGAVKRVVDVGANHGDFSTAATALFPAADVLLIEPQPLLHPELERRCTAQAGRWILDKCAVGDAETTLPLYISPKQDVVGSFLGFSKEYLSINPDVGQVQEVLCPVHTLDQSCDTHRITDIDLLKIDVEGFEFHALRGGEKTLKNTRSLIVEVSLIRKPENTKHPVAEMLGWLLERGFQLVEVIPSLWDPKEQWKPVEFNLLVRR